MTKTATRPKATTAALSVAGIDHVVLHVGDVVRSKAFYTEILGMTVHHDYPQHVFLKCGEQMLALFASPGGRTPGAGTDLNHLAFAVHQPYEDIKAALEEHGIAVGGRSGDDRCIYFEDPDGHQLQIMPDR